MIAGIFLAALLVTDDVALVRPESDAPKGPQYLSRHQVMAVEAGEQLGVAYAGVQKFHSTAGKSALRFAFGADLDGDGVDEIVTVRGAKGTGAKGRFLITVSSAPAETLAKAPPAIASTGKTFLSELGAKAKPVSVDRFDRDGDGRDEMLVVTKVDGGAQRIELRALPTTKHEPLGAPLFSLDVPSVPAGSVIRAFGLPLDGEPGDELVLLRDDGVVVKGAAFLVGPGVVPILVPHFEIGVVAQHAELISVAPCRVGKVPVPGLLLVRHSPFGVVIESRAIDGLGQLAAPSLAATPPVGAAGAAGAAGAVGSGPPFAAFSIQVPGLAPPPPPPGPALQGWSLYVSDDTGQIATLLPLSSSGSGNLVFSDPSGASVTILPGYPTGFESATVTFTPLNFTWQLPLDGTGPVVTLAVSLPTGNGGIGFNSTFGWLLGPNGGTMASPIATITFPGGSPQPVVSLLFHKPHN